MTDSNEATQMDITIVHEPDKYRFELRDGGALIGTAGYLPDETNETWDFNSTHVNSEYGGRGLAAQLVKFELTDAKANGDSIDASCPYVVEYLRKHPELA